MPRDLPIARPLWNVDIDSRLDHSDASRRLSGLLLEPWNIDKVFIVVRATDDVPQCRKEQQLMRTFVLTIEIKERFELPAHSLCPKCGLTHRPWSLLIMV